MHGKVAHEWRTGSGREDGVGRNTGEGEAAVVGIVGGKPNRTEDQGYPRSLPECEWQSEWLLITTQNQPFVVSLRCLPNG